MELSSSSNKQSRINTSIARYLMIKCNFILNLVENSSFHVFMKESNLKWDPISSKDLKRDEITFLTEKMKKFFMIH